MSRGGVYAKERDGRPPDHRDTLAVDQRSMPSGLRIEMAWLLLLLERTPTYLTWLDHKEGKPNV